MSNLPRTMETEPRQRRLDDSPVETAAHASTSSPLHQQSPARDSGETSNMARDSMVTVRLSEPPSLAVDTTTFASTDGATATPTTRPSTVRLDKTPLSTPPLSEAAGGDSRRRDTISQEEDDAIDPLLPVSIPNGARSIEDELLESEEREQEDEEERVEQKERTEETEGGRRRSSVSEEVNWEQLQKDEAEEPKDEDTDRVRFLVSLPSFFFFEFSSLVFIHPLCLCPISLFIPLTRFPHPIYPRLLLT